MSTLETGDGAVIWWAADMLEAIRPEIFDPAWLARQGVLRGAALGRGQSHFLELEGRALVLRQFRRGGLVGRVIADAYLRLGARRSRPYREFRLLEWMHAEGLSVPRPVAARYAPSGLIYRAQLITERIPDAVPLADRLRDGVLAPEVWRAIGGTVRQMHRLGVDHVDLNCRNILLDAAAGVWLIDFDRCRRRADGGWTAANLARLRRSLVKEAGRRAVHFDAERDWTAFLDGYQAGGPVREG